MNPTPRPTFPASRRLASAAALALLLSPLLAPSPARGQSLKGSPASLDRQNRVAREHDFTFLDTGARVEHFVGKGWLVRVRPTGNVELHGVSYPYARPEVALFVERLGAQYRSACGERLVVTSLTRPTSRQPRNASERSVHPTGMALDLRYSRTRSCRQWLEGVLLSLEEAGVLEATRERFPPHYHVAVFPRQYQAHVDRLQARQVTRVAQGGASDPAPKPAPSSSQPSEARGAYRVRSGDSLWTIARAHGTTVTQLRQINGLRGSRIYAGQTLEVPRGR